MTYEERFKEMGLFLLEKTKGDLIIFQCVKGCSKEDSDRLFSVPMGVKQREINLLCI